MLKLSSKLCSARKTLAGYHEDKTLERFPSFINGMHNPFKSIQPAGEARSHLAEDITAANDWFREQKVEAFQKVIKLKEDEVTFLAKQCSPTAQIKQIVDTLDANWALLLKSLEEGTEKPTGSDKGKSVESAIPDILKGDLEIAKGLAPHWATKIWDFTSISTQKSLDLVKSKKDLVSKADVDMTDAPVSNMKELAMDALKEAIKEMGYDRKGSGPVSNTHNVQLPATNSSLGKRKQAWSEQEEDQPSRSPWKQQPAAKRPRPPTETKDVRECWRHFELPQETCKWCKRWARKEKESEEVVRSSKWTPTKPSSLPRQILDLPTDKAMSLIQSRMPLPTIVDADFDVKLGPGVPSIPENIDSLLSMGHRFLFPSVFNVMLPLECYASLSRRVKWIVHFGYAGNTNSFLDENPQFRIRKENTTAEPRFTPIWVSALLEKGRLEMIRQIEAIPSTVVNAPLVPNYKRELTALREWRKTNNLLVLQSDKNLGTTVISSEWYSEKLDNLVLNNPDFTPISEEIYLGMMGQARREIESYEHDDFYQEIKDYILADLTIEKARSNVPKFHGLPKVHKDPWALRPIVPCHSYPLSNASKVLSMILKLRVRESPWILESTQDLARILETVLVPSGKKYWIASGDVTAMYPNIPRKRAHQILGEIATEVDNDPNSDGNGSTAEFVTKLAAWSDNFLCFKHNNKYFYQKEGLAMGIPAAPDVANLYMSHFENAFAHKFVLYKRYIDDVFVIIDASSRKEALAQLDLVQAEGLKLTWSVDKETINFLDLEVTQEGGKYFSFKPYRKPLNSYERLPWTSYHPVHVKRAAFCGEISRMARLCSNKKMFYNEVSYVKEIYLKRGYPNALLHTWIKKESNNRWESRYKDAPEAEGGSSLWLKSVYNNVWKHIDLHKVWTAMVDGRDIESSPLGHIKDVKLSLKRFRNLGEINNKYNADILWALHVEEEVAELTREDHDDDQPSIAPMLPQRAQIVKLGNEPQTRINFPGTGSHEASLHTDWQKKLSR